MPDNMQSQAMERLKQMYSKAQTPQGSTTNASPVNKKSQAEENKENTEQEKIKKEVMPFKKGDSIAELFLKDKEKSLILLLIVLLISEKADTSVVLALLYLIL